MIKTFPVPTSSIFTQERTPDNTICMCGRKKRPFIIVFDGCLCQVRCYCASTNGENCWGDRRKLINVSAVIALSCVARRDYTIGIEIGTRNKKMFLIFNQIHFPFCGAPLGWLAKLWKTKLIQKGKFCPS